VCWPASVWSEAGAVRPMRADHAGGVPPSFNALFSAARTGYGSAVLTASEHLARGEVVGVLRDRWRFTPLSLENQRLALAVITGWLEAQLMPRWSGV
jgi:hypothetical protein